MAKAYNPKLKEKIVKLILKVEISKHEIERKYNLQRCTQRY